MDPDPTNVQIELTEVDVAPARGGTESLIAAVNWSVKEGDYWVIGGAQASGKSDLVATAAGMQRPLRGTVKLFGRDLAGLSEAELLELRLGVGMVFKNGGRLFSHMTLAENIALPLLYRNNWSLDQAADRVNALLRLMELEDIVHTTPSGLAMAWLQRAGLARALALEPRVLILDEPMAGLDVRHRRWWQEFLGRLSTGIPEIGGIPVTLIVATNDLTPWSDIGRQFARIERRRWTVIGGRDDLKQVADAIEI